MEGTTFATRANPGQNLARKPAMSPVPTPDMPDGSIMPTADPPKVRYGIVKVPGLDVFYREAGRPDAPKLCCCTDRKSVV